MTNQLECMFLICDSHLFFYNGTLSQVCLASNLLKTSENSFLINASKSPSNFVLAQVTQSYGYFKIEEVFVDLDSPDDVVKYWGMDQSLQVLIMLREGVNGTQLVVYDMDKHQVLLASYYNHIVMHVLKTQEYQLDQGHLYYAGNVIKLRYDLMTPDSNLDDVLFDHQNILNLKNGENVKSMPMMSLKYNKIVYLT